MTQGLLGQWEEFGKALAEWSQPVFISAARYVTIPLAAAITGMTEYAIRGKIHDGHWVEGKEFRRDPVGGLFIDLQGVSKWIESGPGVWRKGKAGKAARLTKE